MIEEPIIFLGVLILSWITSSLLISDRAGVLKPIAFRLGYIGVIFHEISHYLMSLAVGKMPEKMKIEWHKGKNGERSAQGSVSLEKPPSFLQAVVIALGPLYISTWFIFLFWFGIILNPVFDPVIKTIAVFVIISLFLGASPSTGDLRYVTNSFRKSPTYSWYQIFLIILSGVILWMILLFTQITFFLDFFYYLAIAGIYLILKFSLIGLRSLTIRLQSRNFKKPEKIRFNHFSRKHYKPKKPWKEN
jgi:hypothetical protein